MAITRYITSITATFNPFHRTAKAARLFLAYVPPNSQSSDLKVKKTLLPRTSDVPSRLQLKFRDGREMDVDLEKTKIKDLLQEVQRLSRQIQKQEDLSTS